MGTKLDPLTRKITLVELDLGQEQDLFFNWTAGVWYVDFDAVYELIDPIYLVGVSAQPSISKVASVMEDGVQLTVVASVALCISTDSSFFYDIADRRLYVHLGGGDEPAIHVVVIGIAFGVSNHACDYNGMHYEPRLRSASALTKRKDPLFFGRISFDGGSIGIENSDGSYDQLASVGSALWGGAVRVLQGFDDDAYAAFIKSYSGVVEGLGIAQGLATVSVGDKRSTLSRRAPRNTFTIGAYPYIHYDDLGKAIPLLYGYCKKVPVVCTNRDALGPASYSFKVCDTTDHAIEAIDHVYIDDVEVTPSSVNLATATFTLVRCSGSTTTTTAGKLIAAAGNFIVNGVRAGDYCFNVTDGTFAKVVTRDSATQLSVDADVFPTGKSYAIYPYEPGAKVTASVHGYTDGASLITNAADVILDLLVTQLGFSYTAPYFNLTEWAAATALAMDVGLFVGQATEVFQLIEEACASSLLNLIQQDDGLLTLRIYDPLRAVSDTYSPDQLMETPTVTHDVSQVLTSTDVGYDRDWEAGSFQRLHDTSREAAIYAVYKTYREQKFDTLLTTPASAQAFSDMITEIGGRAITRVGARFKLQPLGREIMDFVMLPVYRQGKEMLGMKKCEIGSITKNLLTAEVTVEGIVI